MRLFRRLLRPVALIVVLATAAFLVPNSAVQPTDAALVAGRSNLDG